MGNIERWAGEDSAEAELSRRETDITEIHDALVDAGLDGAINAEGIIARISQLAGAVEDRDRYKAALEEIARWQPRTIHVQTAREALGEPSS